jgi:hypothetical protein
MDGKVKSKYPPHSLPKREWSWDRCCENHRTWRKVSATWPRLRWRPRWTGKRCWFRVTKRRKCNWRTRRLLVKTLLQMEQDFFPLSP